MDPSAPPPYVPDSAPIHPPSAPTTQHANGVDTTEAMRRLRSLSFPKGIASMILHMSGQYTHLIKIFDTSGSMRTCDGRVFDGRSNTWKTTTRWLELVDSLEFDLRTLDAAGALDKATYWPLFGDRYIQLPPGQSFFSGDQLGQNIGALRNFNPSHCTPIIETLLAVRSFLEQFPNARPHITLLCDGNDDTCQNGHIGPLADVMVGLKRTFCADFVVRLITDDDKTVEAYNNLDKAGAEQLNLDVLDDLKSEQAEVNQAGNSFVICDHVLTELRIAGSTLPCLDNLDEQALTSPEFKTLCGLIYGVPPEELPDPDTDWPNFEKFMSNVIRQESQLAIDCHTGKRQPWIDLKKAKRRYHHGSNCCIS